MDYGFDLNSQESIAFANVIMENDDSNMAARALLQSWASNIPKNLSNAAASKSKTYYSQRSMSSSINHRKPKILSRMNSNTSQIEKLENQLEKEKKLNKYKQEILEQKLKSDLEIYRKEYRVLKELEKKIKKPSGNTNDNKLKTSTKNKKIIMKKSSSYMNDDTLDLEDKENINKNGIIQKESETIRKYRENSTIKNSKTNIKNEKEMIKSKNISDNTIMNSHQTSLISNTKKINKDSLKDYTMDDMIHLIDDLIQNNAINNNIEENISNKNEHILYDNLNDDKKTSEIIKNNESNSDITNNINDNNNNNGIDNNEDDDDTINNDSIDEDKDSNNEKKLIMVNNNEQQNNIIEESKNEVKDTECINDIKKIPLIKKDILEKKEESLDRTSIESIYHMKVHLKAWYLLIVNDNYKCKNFQEKNNWKLKNYIFSTWMKAYKKSKNQRELIEEAENYKNEQIKMIKATKFWMQTTKSKCFAAWTIYSQISKQENQIKEQHKNRIKKMNEFLNIAKQRLQEKQSQEEELKMNHLTEVINQDKNIGERLLKISKEFSTPEVKEDESFQRLSTTSRSSTPPSNVPNKPNKKSSTILKDNKKKTTLNTSTSSMRKFKSTKPRITKADKKFCEEMEKRNQAILERKRQSEQRRKEKEEKLRKQREEEERKKEEERKLEIQRERQRKIEERKKAKMEQIEKEKRREKFLKDVAKAKEHYRHNLLSRYGLLPWKKYSVMVKKDEQISLQFHQDRLKNQFFTQWYNKILDKQEEEEHRAIIFHRKKCLKKYFSIFINAYQEHIYIEDNCDEFYLLNLMKSSWKCWIRQHHLKQEEEKKRQEALEEIADNYAKNYVPKRFLRKWVVYYRNKKDEQWREYRKELLRGKVKEWLSHSNLNTQTIPQ